MNNKNNYKDNLKDFIPIDLHEMRKEGFLKNIDKRCQQQIFIVENKNGWKSVKECPLCKSEKRVKEFTKLSIDIFCCENCSLRYLGKIPNEVKDILDDESFLPRSIGTYMENVEYRKERFGKERIKLIKSLMKKEGVKLLDVGCGTGWFLEVAKENGFEIYGQEASKELSEFTSKRLDIKIWNEPLENLKTNMKFDVISLFDVLEHIKNPVEFLENCKRLLVDDGIIVVFTPNFDSLAIHIMKEHSNLICPEHLIYFTEDSVKTLAEKLDMKILHYKTCGIDFGDLKSYYESVGKENLARACVDLYPLVQPVVDGSGSGNHMRFVLRKNKMENNFPKPVGKKGKILFIIPDSYQDDNPFPLGPAYLASVLKQAGHDVQVYCQDVFHYSNKELAHFLDNNSFDVICIGFLAARYSETIRPLAKVIIEHKKNAKFVLGGHCVSAIPEYILKDTKADIAVLGEGEEIITPLLRNILEGNNLDKMPGIAFRTKEGVRVNPREEPPQDLDSVPFPAWDLFPIKEYSTTIGYTGCSDSDKTLAVISSRGCVNKCSFCYRLEKGIRSRSVENLFEELKELYLRFGINYFLIEDEMFIPSKERIKKLVSKIKDLGAPIKYGCSARVELAKDKEILKMLKDSGCQLLNFGLESLDQNVLDLIGKNVKVEDNYLAVENTIEAGIHPGLNFIWGNPGDSPESLNKIVDFLIKYDTQGQFRTIRPPTPYPGCPLYYLAIKEGKLKGPGDFFEKFKNSDRLTVNFTKMSDEKVHSLLLEANTRLIKNYFEKIGNPNSKAEKELIEGFRRVYFPTCLEDLQFRGARHYKKKIKN